MKNEFKKSIMTAALFISVGLFISVLVFFLLFGKGLQILMPFILFSVFFIVFLLLEKLPFVSKHPVLKFVISVAFVIIVIVLI